MRLGRTASLQPRAGGTARAEVIGIIIAFSETEQYFCSLISRANNKISNYVIKQIINCARTPRRNSHVRAEKFFSLLFRFGIRARRRVVKSKYLYSASRNFVFLIKISKHPAPGRYFCVLYICTLLTSDS